MTERLEPEARVPYRAPLDLVVQAEGLDGRTPSLRVNVRAAGLPAPCAPPGELRPRAEVSAFQDGRAALRGWRAELDDDPRAQTDAYVLPFERPDVVERDGAPAFAGLTGERAAIADQAHAQFTRCIGMVRRHGVFYFWSDHAHHHAVDTATKMARWCRYFVAPYVPGGVDPDSPGWREVFEPLAPWAGFLHDLGMGANERMLAELEQLEALDPVQAEAKALQACSLHGVSRQPLDELCRFLRDTCRWPDDAVDQVAHRGLRALSKELVASDKHGIRACHGVNSTMHCLDEGLTSTRALMACFTPFVRQRMAFTVAMHSKSRYGRTGILAKDVEQGVTDALTNADPARRFGALPAASPAAPSAPATFGGWLADTLTLELLAVVEGAEGSPCQGPTVVTSERPYALALARCIGVVDNLRDRGNRNGDKFRDNQGVSFRKLPLDEGELETLRRARQDGAPTRVACGSFRLVSGPLGQELRDCGTFLEVLRCLSRHERWRDLFGRAREALGVDLGPPGDGARRFAEAVPPGLLRALAAHMSERDEENVLVPPSSWTFNRGELGIHAAGLSHAGELRIPAPTPLTVVQHVVLDTDHDPADVALIVADILGEGPRALPKGWIVALEAAPGCVTPIADWLQQGFTAPAPTLATPHGAFPGPARSRLQPRSDATFEQWLDAWRPWDLAAEDRVGKLRSLLREYAQTYQAALWLRQAGAWTRGTA